MFVALGFIFAVKAGLVNIGAEGQILIGGTAAVATAVCLRGLPGPVPLVAGLLCGFAAGGSWAAIAGFLKARLGVNEVIVTLLLNYLAANLIEYAVDLTWARCGLTANGNGGFVIDLAECVEQ